MSRILDIFNRIVLRWIRALTKHTLAELHFDTFAKVLANILEVAVQHASSNMGLHSNFFLNLSRKCCIIGIGQSHRWQFWHWQV